MRRATSRCTSHSGDRDDAFGRDLSLNCCKCKCWSAEYEEETTLHLVHTRRKKNKNTGSRNIFTRPLGPTIVLSRVLSVCEGQCGTVTLCAYDTLPI
jgi:hypothetical protein